MSMENIYQCLRREDLKGVIVDGEWILMES